MAFVSGNSPDQNANSDQDPNKNPLADQAPITSAPAGGGGSGKPSGQASSKGPAQPFTNLSAYLTANAPQVQQMGADIAGQLNSDYTTTNNAINSAKDTYGAGVNAGYTPYDQSLIDSFSSNPSSVASDPTKAASFKGMYNDRYTGPGNFQDSPEYADLSGKVQKSGAFAKQVSTIPGLESYLSAKSPTYTQGQATLDSALLQTNPDAVQSIATAAQPFQNLPGYLDQAVAQGNQLSQSAVASSQAAKEAATKAAGDYSTGFAKTQNDQMADYSKKATDYNLLMNSATAKINSGDFASLTPEEQKLVGYNPASTDLLKNYASIFPTQAGNKPLTPQNYFTPGDQARQPTGADVLSPDELANYQALQQLTGNGPMLNFDAPAAGTEGSWNMPGKLPAFNNVQALTQIQMSYKPMYDQLVANGFQGVSAEDKAKITSYMNSLNSALGGPQPSPTPTTPMPTDPGLGSGYHWDPDTGTWQVNIPLQPPGSTSGGDGGTGSGGHHWF